MICTRRIGCKCCGVERSTSRQPRTNQGKWGCSKELELSSAGEGIAIVAFEDVLSPERLNSPDENLQSFP